ncbi:MAG: LysE family transporter [Candidatus Thorarchaeota archaeon]
MIEIFLISFVVGISGAVTPGPVLTFTIYKSLKEEKGYLAGFFIILGHLVLELALLIILLLGASLLFQNLIFLIILGIVGGSCLITFGVLTIKDVHNRRYELDFDFENQEMTNFKGNSFVGGIFYSITNPYWEFWWATAGIKIMYDLNVSLIRPFGFLLFFFGHELADFVWYVPISIGIFLGGKSLNPTIYKYVLITCGAFMIIFGLYLSFNIILFPPNV